MANGNIFPQKKNTMSLRSPKKKDIQVGEVVEIYNGEGALLGEARLIKRRPSRYRQDGLGYVKYQKKHHTGDEDDIPPEGQQAPTLYIWASERWQVEWVKHAYYRPGDQNCVDVHYYVRTTTDYPSFVDMNTLGNKGVSQDGLYIFIEENGVLTLDGENYTEEALYALKRVKKACNGEIIMYHHSPSQLKERWELNKVQYRIFDFLPTHYSFARAIKEYIENLGEDTIEDYIIISGTSRVKGDRVIQSNLTTGLVWPKKEKKVILYDKDGNAKDFTQEELDNIEKSGMLLSELGWFSHGVGATEEAPDVIVNEEGVWNWDELKPSN